MAGDTTTTLNEYFKINYLEAIEPLAAYNVDLLNAVRRETESRNLVANLGGKGIEVTIQTNQANNAQTRLEGDSWIAPMASGYATMNVKEVRHVGSTSVTLEEKEESDANGKSNLPKDKLEDMKNDLSKRLNQAARGDGTGRLAQIVNSDPTINGGVTVTAAVQNTAGSFGIQGVSLMRVNDLIDIISVSGDTFTIRARNIRVTSVNPATNTFTATATGAPGSLVSTTPADYRNAIVALASTFAVSGTTLNTSFGFNEAVGIHHICDDGLQIDGSTVQTAPFTALGPGSYFRNGNTNTGGLYFGLSRTSYPTLQAKVVRNWTTTTPSTALPASWTIDLLADTIDQISYGESGYKTDLLVMAPKMARQLARKVADQPGAIVNFENPAKLNDIYLTQGVNIGGGRVVNVLATPWLMNEYTIYGLATRAMMRFQPFGVRFFNPITFSNGGEAWFGDLTRTGRGECWVHFLHNLFSRRCDCHFRIEGLKNNE